MTSLQLEFKQLRRESHPVQSVRHAQSATFDVRVWPVRPSLREASTTAACLSLVLKMTHGSDKTASTLMAARFFQHFLF